MKARLLAVLAAVLAYPTAATAGHAYVFVTETADRAYGFLDKATLQKGQGAKITAWTMFVETKLSTKVEGKVLRRSMFQSEYDCFAKNVRGIYAAVYDSNNSIISTASLSEIHPVIPDTVDDKMLDAVCNPDSASEAIPFENADAAINFADFSAKLRKAH